MTKNRQVLSDGQEYHTGFWRQDNMTFNPILGNLVASAILLIVRAFALVVLSQERNPKTPTAEAR